MAELIFVGTRVRPELQLSCARGEKLPADRRRTVNDWVRSLPGRRWDAQEKVWLIDCLGPRPDRTLRRSGLDLDVDDLPTDSLAELVPPLVRLDKDRPGYAKIAPRLSGRTALLARLGPAAVWDETHRRISIPLADLASVTDLEFPEQVRAAIAGATARRGAGVAATKSVATAALAPDLSDAASRRALAKLRNRLGDVPDSFGVDLFEYQMLGCYAVAAGRRLIADQPGLGKTLESLAALTLLGSRRIALVVPPVVLSNWKREYLRSGLPGEPVIFTPERKAPALPDVGAAIVSDSLLAARPALLSELIDWQPDALIYDEAHRAKTWTTKRSVAVRTLAESLGEHPRIALTGTPQTKSPAEIASIMAVTGQLEPVFGSYTAFIDEYCRLDKWGNLLPRKSKLPELRDVLDEQVWVRRYKSDVLPDLPPKQWVTQVVDVSMKDFRQAHRDSLERVTRWVEGFIAEHGREPGDAQIEAYAGDNLGVISPMRKAAGVAKVAAAADWVCNWVEGRAMAADANTDDDGQVASPLLVWCHHHEVMDALREQVVDRLEVQVPIISGATSLADKTRFVDGFQAGQYPVMICQITAAGVGITLTRAQEALFVETDWTDALISQAEDRIHRIGQTSSKVIYTTLLAADTLDEFIHRVRLAKKDIADVVVGRCGGDAADDTQRGRVLIGPADMVRELVDEVLARRHRHRD